MEYRNIINISKMHPTKGTILKTSQRTEKNNLIIIKSVDFLSKDF